MDDTSDQARFAEVFLPHLVDAFRLARWIAGSRADAEDVVQEASMRAFKNIRGFSGGDPRAWVLSIVRNTSYSWLAKNRPKILVLGEDLDQRTRETIEQEDPQTPETALIAKLDAQQVRKAMASLPVPFREVLVLREIHDLDYRTIAEVAALPIGTVMSRLARARSMLAAAIMAGAL
ncbi:MAG TPA: sigma-70 family RNA polymerase sigma factor [Methyloceanibacter sp.]